MARGIEASGTDPAGPGGFQALGAAARQRIGRAAGIEPASKLDSVRVLEEAEIAPLSCVGCHAATARDWEYWKLPLVLQLVGQRRERGRRTKRGQRSGD